MWPRQMSRSFQVVACATGLNRQNEVVTSQPPNRFVRAHCDGYDACTYDCEESETHAHMSARIALGLLAMMSGLVRTVALVSVEA